MSETIPVGANANVAPHPANEQPCQQCPWRTANWGKPTKGGFYTKKNLLRMWNGLRRGDRPQSCHMTDPSHPDHVDAGARQRADGPLECPGSLVVIQREINRMSELSSEPDAVDDDGVEAYLAETNGKRGMTKDGILYHLLTRTMARPFGEGQQPMRDMSHLWDADWIGRPE